MASTTSFNWETPDDTDLVKDGAAAIRTLGNSIDTSMTDLLGGTTGQVLAKASNTDMDFTWVAQDDSNAIQNAIVDAKGDLIAASAADTPARLAVGADYGFLQALASASTGLQWNISAWTNYTPTITANSGTITTATANGYWIRIGKLCAVRTNWAVTTNGTGAGALNLSLPFTSAAGGIGSSGVGREYDVTGKQLQIEVLTSDTVMKYRNYDNTYPAANGYKGVGTVVYEVA